MRARLIALLVLALLLVPGITYAQSPSVEWTRWDALINVGNNNQLQIAETQEVKVTAGSVHHNKRVWTSTVQVQNVYIIGSDSTPQAVAQGNGTSPNTYRVTQSGGQTVLDIELPGAAQTGNSFVEQINYTATSPTDGMVDWKIVPAEHDFPVRSSTARIRFPAGQAPDQSLVRASQGNANVSANGSEITVQSASQIPAGQSFAIQVPFGAGVGAAGNTGNTGNVAPAPVSPFQPADGSSTQIQLPGLGTILLIVCGIGLLLLFGGGSLLRSLLGSFLGGGLGRSSGGGIGSDPFGGSNSGGGGIFGGGQSGSEPPASSGRGFRASDNQDRSIGKVGNDKDSGGGSSFS